MKKLLLLLLVVLMVNWSPEEIKSLAEALTKDYQVGLREFCSDETSRTWYCVSINEYNRLKELPQSCETISITTISGTLIEGVISNDSFRHSTHNCFS